ncbi:MAG: metallophosphoesterase family protein [Anaerolineae bacterium]
MSDVHGDTQPETALERLDNYHNVDQVLCAGDLVGRGPQPEKVVQLIRERGIVTVRGNHDDWNYGLSAENKAYLKDLPLEWRAEVGGRSIFMCHGKRQQPVGLVPRSHLEHAAEHDAGLAERTC